jgi:hypothetical protein
MLLFAVAYSSVFWEERRLTVIENSVLGKIHGPKRDEVREEGENCMLGRLPNIIRVIKSGVTTRTGRVACMG